MQLVNVLKKHRNLLIVTIIFVVIALSWNFITSLSVTTDTTAWDGVVAKSFTSGTGTKENPFLISNASEFAYFKELLEGEDANTYLDKNYKITSGFNYGDYDISINNISPFKGNIDGSGSTINNAKITNSLFNSIEDATIKNIAFKDIDYSLTNSIGGLISNSNTNSTFDLILLEANVYVNSDSSFAGFSYNSSDCNYSKIITNYNINSESKKIYSFIYNSSDDSLGNILVRDYKYSDSGIEPEYYSITGNQIDLSEGINLSNYSNNEFQVSILNKNFIMNDKNIKTAATKGLRSGEHASGLDGTAVYVNDLESDYNYYMGLNYTEITNTNGTIPDGTNQNLYSDSNLATLYIRYNSADINDSSTYGKVSPNEDYRDFYYYKMYPVVNGYVTFDLIDNPWANRPSNTRAFNGWVTDYTNAVISLDIETYTRSVKIPVSNVSEPISITFYASWTIATVINSTNSISGLSGYQMNALTPNYGTLTNYYIENTVAYYSRYPNSNDIWDLDGNKITGNSRCYDYYGCTYLSKNTSNTYDDAIDYYTVTPINNNTATVDVVVLTPLADAFTYYGDNASVAGYFIKVNSGTENIYSATGEKLSSCNGTCYKLLQYADGVADIGTTYYYLTTRDTNIFTVTSNSINASNLSLSRPMTITAIVNGTDYSTNRSIYLNDNWTASADVRIEFVRLYVDSTSTTVTEFNNNGYKVIGGFNNLKIGRGIRRNGSYLTATSFVGGSTSSMTTLTKYKLIVESGFYQNGAGVGAGSSASTHRTIANITLGNDFDRVNNNTNTNLIIYYCYSGSWASNLYNSSSSNDTYDTPAITTIIKSGTFGANQGDYAAGVYVGGRGRGVQYTLRSMTVEGGNIFNLIGGPASSTSRAGKNDIIINVKGGTINMIFGGAGVSNTVGNRILNITGGNINYSILGGSNAYQIGQNSTDPYGKIDGDTLLYVGGNVTVGDTSLTGSLYNIAVGDVFGAGNGREGELDVGSVNNSNVIIGPDADIKGNVYGGGNFGAVGGNTTGVYNDGSNGANSSGVYEDETTDNSIRYYGSNPDNYIQFNGELYRIIGLFNNVSTQSGTKNLVRIVKNTSLGNRAWGDTNMTTVQTNTSTETTSGYWTDNTYNYTNYYKNYYNFYVKNDNSTSNMYNYLNTTYYNGLNNTYKNYIEEVNWGLGATSDINQNANAFYAAERSNGIVNYLTGINQTSNGNSAYTSLFKVGLFYPSDYGFANNDSTCLSSNLGSYSSSCRTNNWMSGMTNAWTMIPSTNVTSVTKTYQVSRTGSMFNGYTYTMNRYYHVSNRNFIVGTGGIELQDIYYTNNDNDANNYYNTAAVYPSFYLKEDVTISSGTGTSSDPYIIGSSEDLLTDIIYEIMYPSTTPEPTIIEHEESDYQARTHIQMLGGTVSGSIYGAGNSNGAGNATSNIALSKINIDINGGEVTGSIYGGSNAEGKVYGDVFLNIENGEITGSVYGGGKGGYDNNSDGTYVMGNVEVTIGSVNTENLTISGNVYGGSAFGTVNALDEDATESLYGTKVTINDGVITGSVFGGGQGDSTHTPKVVGPITVTINDGDMTSVFGGNDQAGNHTELNRIYLNGGTITNVYGGGNRSSVTNTHVYLDGATVTNLYGGSNSLGDVSTTTVSIESGTVTNVYGGNNEGGTCTTTNVTVDGTASITGSVYGGGNQVSSTTTNVTLTSATGTIPNVYGGGNSASVTTSNVTQNGTTVTNLFGGSNSSGTVTTSNIIHTSGTTTNLYGGNNAGGNTITSNITFTAGTATNVYGGGNQANGETSNIEVNGGTITNIYGGGNNAGLTTSNVEVNTGSITNVYGGSNTTGTVTTTNVDINGSTGTISAVYGGGNRAQAGATNVTIDAGTIGNVYGGGNLAQITGNSTVDINGGTINTNVYGGGNFGAVGGSSFVTITDATILGSAYAGGNGSTATLTGNANITIDGDTVIGTNNSVAPTSGCVFGGGNQAATGTTSNSVTSTVNIAGATIYGNVYGGANTSVIYGNTIVNIGKSVPNISNLDKTDIFIKGHVFGGGEANASGSEIYDWDFISVTQGTNITIDADTYTNFDIKGSFFGGGNASSASGDSYLTISNYGTTGSPKENISIQRVTNVTINNSSILLNGAVDRANEYSNELFSISRVVTFNLKNNSEMYFKTGANLLENFNSLDSSGNYAVVTIDTDNNSITTRTVDNRIYMYEGKNLNIAKDQQVTDYGIVKGMTFLGIFNFDGLGNVNTGIYDSSYDPGDLLDWAGVFTRGSYVLGAHVTNHDIEADGFYSNFINEETTVNEVNYIDPTPTSGRFYMWYIGENVIEYNVNLVASKYSTLGSVEASFLEFSKPNTSFQILSFDSSEITTGVSLIDKNNIPRIAATPSDANNKFGLTMEASNNGWLTTGKTMFYTNEPSMSGTTYYEGENSNVVPTMLFYLHHSKNLSEAKDLGTVRISVMAITKINALSNEIKRLVINVNMSTALFQTTEYEGAMTPGDKYELFASTATNLTTKSKLSAYYGLYANGTNLYPTGYHRVLTSSYVLPVNTKITMLDFIEGSPEYYYHVIDSTDVSNAQAEFALEGECSYALSMFTRMGSKSNNSNYDDATKNGIYYDGTDSSEEFIFIVDFSDTNIASDQLGNTLLLEIRDANEETMITVLGMQHSQLTYNLYHNMDSTIDLTVTPSDNPLYIGYSDTFDILINYQSSTLSGVAITDTQYFDSKLGSQIYIKDSEGNVVSGTDLTGAYFIMDNVRYYPDIAGYTHIKLSDKVGNARKWIIFNTENSSLATGSYTFVFETFASSDGIYYSKGTPEYENVSMTIINSKYGLDPQLDDNSVIFSANNDKNLLFTIRYTSLLDNPNIRLALYRRKYDTVYDTNYELVDLQDYLVSVLRTTNNENEYLLKDGPLATESFNIAMESELMTGTYRLAFRLYDDDTQIGEIIRYIIVK